MHFITDTFLSIFQFFPNYRRFWGAGSGYRAFRLCDIIATDVFIFIILKMLCLWILETEWKTNSICQTQQDEIYDLPLANYLNYCRGTDTPKTSFWNTLRDLILMIFLIFFSDTNMQITWRDCMPVNLGRCGAIYSCICRDSHQRVYGINSMLYNWYVICINYSSSDLNCSVKKLFQKNKALRHKNTCIF